MAYKQFYKKAVGNIFKGYSYTLELEDRVIHVAVHKRILFVSVGPTIKHSQYIASEGHPAELAIAKAKLFAEEAIEKDKNKNKSSSNQLCEYKDLAKLDHITIIAKLNKLGNNKPEEEFQDMQTGSTQTQAGSVQAAQNAYMEKLTTEAAIKYITEFDKKLFLGPQDSG